MNKWIRGNSMIKITSF